MTDDEPTAKVASDQPIKRPRQPGRLEDLIVMDERFFEPLPEEELMLWEGRGDEFADKNPAK